MLGRAGCMPDVWQRAVVQKPEWCWLCSCAGSLQAVMLSLLIIDGWAHGCFYLTCTYSLVCFPAGTEQQPLNGAPRSDPSPAAVASGVGQGGGSEAGPGAGGPGAAPSGASLHAGAFVPYGSSAHGHLAGGRRFAAAGGRGREHGGRGPSDWLVPPQGSQPEVGHELQRRNHHRSHLASMDIDPQGTPSYQPGPHSGQQRDMEQDWPEQQHPEQQALQYAAASHAAALPAMSPFALWQQHAEEGGGATGREPWLGSRGSRQGGGWQEGAWAGPGP